MTFAAFFKSRGFRRFRIVFRWVRVTVLFALFLLVASVAYLHFVGLPDFLKRSLLDRLRERGFEVQFTSARLGWGSEVLVENAAFHRTDRPLAPRLAAGETEIQLDPAKLLHRRLSLTSLRISQGSLQLPFSETGGDCLDVNNVFLDLDLLPNDTVHLREGHAFLHGIEFDFRGTVTNYLAARKLNLWPAAAANVTNAPAAPPENSLRQLATTLDQFHFQSAPRVNLILTADGRDLDLLRAKLSIEAADVQTPWGYATGIKLTNDCVRPLHSGSDPFMKVSLSAGAFITPEVRGSRLYLTADVFRDAQSNLLAAVEFTVNSAAAAFPAGQPGSAKTNTVRAASLSWKGNLTLQTSPPDLKAASGHLQALRLATPWGSADSAALACNASAIPGAPADAPWSFKDVLHRWALDCQADLAGVATPDVQLDRLACAALWRAPELILTNLEASLYGGSLSGRARFNADSRELDAGAAFDFEAHRLAHLLPPLLQTRLNEMQWQRPPRANFQVRLILPSLSHPPPDWAARLPSSLQLSGDFSIGPASFRGFSFDAARSRFSYSNRVWDIPRFHLVRPGGEALVDFTSSDETGGFSIIIDSSLDPAGLRPLLPAKQQSLLDEAAFSKTNPPLVHAEISGLWPEPEKLAVNARLAATNFTVHGETVDGLDAAVEIRGPWGDPGKLAADARLSATNFTFRGETVDGLLASVELTNLLLRLRDARAFKDGGELAVPLAEMDLSNKKISLSNAVSTLDKGIAVRLLGSDAPDWLRVLGFDTPPTIRTSGSFVPGDETATDLSFDVSGRNFRYSRFLADSAAGQVLYLGKTVTLTNVQAGLYGGSLSGAGVFGDDPRLGTTFRGQVYLTGIQLPLVVRGWSSKSNNVEGELEGHVFVTGGGSADRKSWTAASHLSVNHALLWDIRLFGIFSKMLNAIIPGAGNNRAYQASADFLLTNGLVATDNLQIRSTDFRFLYHGTVSLDKQLDARVEVLVLRDFPIFGHIFSWAATPLSKLFEYKIAGTLDAPTYRSLYIPKALFLILEPFHKKAPAPDAAPPADTPPSPANPPH
jgi:hypothetical protein